MTKPSLLEVIQTPPARDRSPVCRGLAKPPELDREELQIEPKGGDRQSGLIRGASLIAQGEALGHYAWIDEVMLAQVAEYGNKLNKGVKVRFTHPSLSGDGLGTFLGRAKNLSVQDGKVLGDVHFSPASRETPDGDLGQYVMQLAKDDPESFGMSIVFDHDYKAEKEFIRANEKIDEDGYAEFVSPDPANEHNYRHVRLSALYAVDFVDEPAANPEGLFHRGQPVLAQAESLAAYVLGLSQDAPPDAQGVSPDRVRDFLNRFLASRGLKLSFSKDGSMTTDTKPSEAAPQNPPEAAPKPELLQAELVPQDTSALKAEGAAEERKRQKQIRALCAMSNCPEKADQFIEAEFTVDETRESLSSLLEKQNKVIPADDSTDKTPESGKLATAEKEYKAEYQAQKKIHEQLGISEEQYVEQRLIEDGHKEQPAIMPGLQQ